MGVGILDFVAGLVDKKPKTPNAPQVNALDQSRAAFDYNAGALDKTKALAASANSFNFDQLQAMLKKAIPGYDSLMAKTGGIINSELNGEIPQDVSDAVQRNAAARAIGGGYGGSGMQQNLTARDLGLTSLDLTNKGLDSASKWISQAKQFAMPQTFDLTSMFIKPEMLIQNEWNNQLSTFQRDTVRNQIDQKYSWQHQLAEGIRDDSATIGEIAKSVAGSAIGGAI